MVAFVVVDYFASPRTAVLFAMGLGLAIGLYFYLIMEDFDQTILFELALLLVLGFISLYKNHPVWFKFQPVVTGVLLALFLLWFQLFDVPYLVKFIPRIAAIAPDKAAVLELPEMQLVLARLSGLLVPAFLLHAVAVGWCALKKSDLAWILTRLAIWPILFLLMISVQIYTLS